VILSNNFRLLVNFFIITVIIIRDPVSDSNIYNIIWTTLRLGFIHGIRLLKSPLLFVSIYTVCLVLYSPSYNRWPQRVENIYRYPSYTKWILFIIFVGKCDLCRCVSFIDCWVLSYSITPIFWYMIQRNFIYFFFV